MTNLVWNSSIQSVETGDNVSHVQEGSPILHHLVEHVVPEELQHVSIASLGPGRVKVKFCPVHDCSQLCQ